MADEPRMIRCVGEDDLQHVCLPDSKVCKCGVPVTRKKPLKNDWMKFSCYACTY